MDKATRAMLSDADQALLREAEPKALARLDEDGLVALHDRIRRARNKYSKLYRRRAAARVTADASRAKAHVANARTIAKAEVFEEALATVSRHLAKAAAASARELKAERLAAARAGTGTPAAARKQRAATAERSAKKPASRPSGTSRGKAPRQTPASNRARAATRATTGRSQARRDSR